VAIHGEAGARMTDNAVYYVLRNVPYSRLITKEGRRLCEWIHQNGEPNELGDTVIAHYPLWCKLKRENWRFMMVIDLAHYGMLDMVRGGHVIMGKGPGNG
jgi:hypothetical protein